MLGVDEDAEREAENHEEAAEENGGFLEHVRGLRAEDLIRHLRTEGGAEAFLLRTLHEHDEQQQGAVDEEEGEDDVDGDVEEHGGLVADDERFVKLSGLVQAMISLSSLQMMRLGTMGLSSSAKLMMTTRSPCLMRCAAPPLMMICPVPGGPTRT